MESYIYFAWKQNGYWFAVIHDYPSTLTDRAHVEAGNKKQASDATKRKLEKVVPRLQIFITKVVRTGCKIKNQAAKSLFGLQGYGKGYRKGRGHKENGQIPVSYLL